MACTKGEDPLSDMLTENMVLIGSEKEPPGLPRRCVI